MLCNKSRNRNECDIRQTLSKESVIRLTGQANLKAILWKAYHLKSKNSCHSILFSSKLSIWTLCSQSFLSLFPPSVTLFSSTFSANFFPFIPFWCGINHILLLSRQYLRQWIWLCVACNVPKCNFNNSYWHLSIVRSLF